MNEAETRAEHIDPALASAGWGVVETKGSDNELTKSLLHQAFSGQLTGISVDQEVAG